MSKKVIFTDYNYTILATYLKEIGKLEILPQEEILKLISKAQEGDISARNAIVQSNLRFVVTIAKQWQNRGVPLMDLISEGNKGLIHAIKLFDPSRNVPFLSYAVHWVKQYIYQAIYWTGRAIRLPVTQEIKIAQITKATAEFNEQHGRDPSPQELSKITEIDVSDINYLAQFRNKLISVNDYLGGQSDHNQVCDVIPDKTLSLDTEINKQYLYEELEKVLVQLSIREHDVICLLFGFGREPLEKEEIAAMYGVGPERIRQIKESALKKLRTRFRKQMAELLT